MDEDGKPPVGSPKSPDDGEQCLPTSHGNLHVQTPGPAIDVDRNQDPLIEKPKVKPEGLLEDKENGNNNRISQPDLTTPSKSITWATRHTDARIYFTLSHRGHTRHDGPPQAGFYFLCIRRGDTRARTRSFPHLSDTVLTGRGFSHMVLQLPGIHWALQAFVT
ncbi:hypothetical protein DPEC_G00211510 [Dallia pectoralis]|uniref:Uncharacterized protein n=1 Tax=Dallia pectoralis TaxID=75939 RepID=A0ACC2G6G7_DALPE|nr:hypothetical protein DPEC_G00211510 [Dallia pectoralis]